MLVATPRLIVAAVVICVLWAAVGWPWWAPAIVFSAALIAGELWARRRRGRRDAEGRHEAKPRKVGALKGQIVIGPRFDGVPDGFEEHLERTDSQFDLEQFPGPELGDPWEARWSEQPVGAGPNPYGADRWQERAAWDRGYRYAAAEGERQLAAARGALHVERRRRGAAEQVNFGKSARIQELERLLGRRPGMTAEEFEQHLERLKGEPGQA